MDDLTNGFRKWIGYIATGITTLIFFGVTGWLALVLVGYVYLKHLWQQNPVVEPAQQQVVTQPTPQVETNSHITNHSPITRPRRISRRRHIIEPLEQSGKLPPDQVTPPIDRY
jgi:hypothetical protein